MQARASDYFNQLSKAAMVDDGHRGQSSSERILTDSLRDLWRVIVNKGLNLLDVLLLVNLNRS